MKTIDARGKNCPQPLIMTKQALTETQGTETFLVLLDNETSAANVCRMLSENNIEYSESKEGNQIQIIVGQSKYSKIQTIQPETYCDCQTTSEQPWGIAVQRTGMGDGDAQLGEMLMKAFINTLPEMEKKPDFMVFLNSGIFLTLKDSPVLQALTKLKLSGTDMLVCGTCADFYNKKSEVGVGDISNMYDILDKLSTASKVIYP